LPLEDKFALKKKYLAFFEESLTDSRWCLFPSKSKVNLEIYKRM